MEQKIEIFSNLEIFLIYQKLVKFYSNTELKLPITFIYYLNKNIKAIEKIYISIEEVFLKEFKAESLNLDQCDEETKKRYFEFCEIKNNIPIEVCPLELLADVKLSLQDYQAIDFMIKTY